MQIQSRLPGVGITIFTVMSRLAEEHGAINLSQGFPDFGVDEKLISLVEKYMLLGKNQYAPMEGVLSLRSAISDNAATMYGRVYDPLTEVTVTSGGTEAIFSAITAVVHRGDEVIILEPAYDSYVPALTLAGGIPVPVPLRHPAYSVDWDMVRDAVTGHTRLIILNFPHNPTGAVLSGHDISALREIVNGTDILILSDEVYQHIVFDGIRHESMSRYDDLAARSFIIGSFGKTFHATGWKTGYCLAPSSLTAEMRKVHQYVTFSTSTPVQHALGEYMEDGTAHGGLSCFYQEKRDLFLSRIKGSRFTFIPSGGTYFQLLDYSAISDEDEASFARRMTIEHGVAAIPPSVFYGKPVDNRVLRFCFAKKDETLEKATELLCSI